MDVIKLEATEKTPKVIIDKENNSFEIVGNSRPENVRAFYSPLVDELEKIFESNPDNFTVNFKYGYFNSASAKFISDILLIIKDKSEKGLNTSINWYYEAEDEDMKEAGEDFCDMLDINMAFIKMNEA
jgi:hypothetical protein